MILRDYQEAAVEACFKYLSEEQGNPLLALPTGTGKSVIIAEICKRALSTYPGVRIINATHVKELISQDTEKIFMHWPTAPVGIFSAGLSRKEHGFPITFAGIASAVKTIDLFGYQNLLLIDEAHLVSPKEGTMYQELIAGLKIRNPSLRVVGFTATHYRLGQGLLTEPGGIFTDVAFDLTDRDSFNWLIDHGHICPLIPRKTQSELNTEGVRTSGGEFVQKDLQAAVDRQEVTYATLKESLELGANRDHWLIFASGIEHATHIRDMLESLGVSTTCVHSKMGTAERDANLEGFKSGKYRAMVNNGILTTGFDFPALDMIIMLRPTQSPSLWVQMLGRGTRMFPGKPNCLVLDFAGNTRRLGPINDPVLPNPKGKRGKGHAPVKLCEACGTYNHTSVRFCISCAGEFHQSVKIKVGASTDALIARDKKPEEPDAAPIVKSFAVERVTYSVHKKMHRPDVLKVSYFCGLNLFQEWVCLEHQGYASKRARDWWRLRSATSNGKVLGKNPPATVAEAIERIKELRTSKKIRVWVNTKHPQVMAHEC